MRMCRYISLLLLGCVAGLAQTRARKEPATYLGPGTPTAVTRVQPPSRSSALGRHGSIALGALTAEERGKLGAVGMKNRIGVHRALPEGALDRGTWATLADGRAVWRLGIGSAGASGLRVQFSDFSVGDGKVWVHAGEAVDGPYTAQGPYGNGEFWSGSVTGESVVIEYQAAVVGVIPFRVRRVAHQAQALQSSRWLDIASATDPTVTDRAASCNLDVNCFPDWQEAKKSVAQIQFEETEGLEQGTFLCSASLVGTRDNSFKPYLLTAGHCIHDEAAARSLQTFWAYESSGCNDGPPASRGTLNSSNGGHLVSRGTIEQGDYSLVLLPDVPKGVVFAGWDTGDPDIGSRMVGIHHPAGSYKRISFGQTISSFDVVVGSEPAPASLYHNVIWGNGTAQPGSSGSPLFSGPGVVTGMLTYGPDLPGEELCLASFFVGYGKFSNAYTYLQNYLEDLPFSVVQPSPGKVHFDGLNHAISGSLTQTVTLTVESTDPVSFGLRSDAPWVQLSPSSGTVSASAPAKIQVSVNPKYFLQSDTYTTTVAILSGAAPPQYFDVQVTMKIETSNIVVSAVPNPVPQSGTTWRLSLHLAETNGAATRLTGLKIDGVDYTANIPAWFGTAIIPANGAANGIIHTSGLVTPVLKFFEFFGRDAASGQTWYRTMLVTFVQ